MLRSLRAIALLTVAVAAAFAVPASARAAGPEPTPAPTSPFVWRGIIEGFYGTPWTHGERSRMLRWMGPHGFNAYVRAPKGDVLQTTAWRQPYPAATQAKFDAEIALARARGIQWIPSLSPARGSVTSRNRICFSCPADLDAMVAKLGPFLAAGSETVMVSFDDIAPLLGPTDAAAYAARFPGTAPEYQFGRATAEFLNALAARLPGVGLLTVLPDYAGTTDSAYLQGTRDGALDPDIGVMWTGPNIRASDFTAAEADLYGQLIGRTPIVWANWVTRDFVPTRLFLGPFSKRNDVTGSVQGFFFNPMNEPDLNRLPLATAGAWLQDPDGYNRRRSWLAAVDELSRRTRPLRSQLRAWAETSYSSGLLRNEAPTSVRLQDAFLTALDGGARWTDAATALRQELRLVRRAPRGLRELRNRRIAAQARPFLAAARQAAAAGERGVDLLAAERPSLTVQRARDGFAGTALPPDPEAASALRAQLSAEWAAVRASPLYVYGCRVRTRGCGARAYNRMDAFLTQVTSLDALWAPQAERAAARLRVTVGDVRVRVRRDGSFALPADACGKRVLATDGAGGETSLPLPRCPRRKPQR